MQFIMKNDIYVPKGMVYLDFHNVLTDKHEIIIVKNLVTDAGKASIAAGLIEQSNKGKITYCALGTDNTAPDAANTALGTELARKQISVRSVASNIATFQTFFTTAEAIGALKEAGLFGDDASATTDSGTLYCHTAIDRTKTANDTLTLSWAVTIG